MLSWTRLLKWPPALQKCAKRRIGLTMPPLALALRLNLRVWTRMHHKGIAQCSGARPKEAEWSCRVWAFVWPQYCDQTNPAHRHISQTLRLVLSLYDIAGTLTGLFHVPEDRGLILKTAVHLIAHYNWLAKWAQGQGLKRWTTVLNTPLCWALGTASAVAPLQCRGHLLE